MILVYGLALHEFSIVQVDRAPALCLEDHRFESCRDADVFFVPRSWRADYFVFTFVSLSLKFNIFHFFLEKNINKNSPHFNACDNL